MSGDNIPTGEASSPKTSVEAVVVYSTFPTEAAALVVAEALVSAGLVACANIIPAVTSVYIWQGRLEREHEVAMIMKTQAALAVEVVAQTRQRHPYDNPAVVVLPIATGSADYLTWIAEQTRSAGR